MADRIPTHERTWLGGLLTMAAGGIDAYSYLLHGQVFAGLQTGNLILLGIKLGQGHWFGSLRYLISLVAFFIGTVVIRLLQRNSWVSKEGHQRRQIVLIYEAILLLVVAATATVISNMLTVTLLAFTAAAELQEFRRLNGGPFTPLMMTGNVRLLAEATFDALFYHETAAQKKLKATGTIMLTFLLGAMLIAIAVPWLHQFAIVIPAGIILSIFGLISSLKN